MKHKFAYISVYVFLQHVTLYSRSLCVKIPKSIPSHKESNSSFTRRIQSLIQLRHLSEVQTLQSSKPNPDVSFLLFNQSNISSKFLKRNQTLPSKISIAIHHQDLPISLLMFNFPFLHICDPYSAKTRSIFKSSATTS